MARALHLKPQFILRRNPNFITHLFSTSSSSSSNNDDQSNNNNDEQSTNQSPPRSIRDMPVELREREFKEMDAKNVLGLSSSGLKDLRERLAKLKNDKADADKRLEDWRESLAKWWNDKADVDKRISPQSSSSGSEDWRERLKADVELRESLAKLKNDKADVDKRKSLQSVRQFSGGVKGD